MAASLGILLVGWLGSFFTSAATNLPSASALDDRLLRGLLRDRPISPDILLRPPASSVTTLRDPALRRFIEMNQRNRIYLTGTNLLVDEMDKTKPWESKLPGESYKNVKSDTPDTVVPPPANNGSALSNPLVRQLLDQRQNWIFMTPELQNASLEESMGIRDSSTTADTDKPKKAAERYFDSLESVGSYSKSDLLGTNGADAKSRSGVLRQDPTDTLNSPNQTANSAYPDLASRSLGLPSLGGSAPDRPGSPALNSTFNLGPDANNYPSLEFANPLKNDPARAAEMRRRDDFRQLLQTGQPSLLPNGLTDPISLWSDGSRRDLQPVTGMSLDDAKADKSRRNILGGIPTIDDVYKPTRPAFLDDFNSKAMGVEPPSRPLAPTAVEAFQPKWHPFEMPKRAF